MASSVTAAVYKAALAVSKTGSVSIPNAHFRCGGDASTVQEIRKTVSAPKAHAPVLSAAPEMPSITSAPVYHHHHRPGYGGVDHLGGVNVTGAKASDQGVKPMFQLLAETTESITPGLLAKHHLPGILLQHGPLAIRHITAHLIASLPGFSTIPPAKQRRIVVGALEGRGGCSGVMGEVGGLNGDVIFEKVGWGRWDARKKGDPPLERPVTFRGSVRPEKNRELPSGDPGEMHYSRSYTGESGIFIQSEEESAHGEDVDMADTMSLDQDSTATSEDDDMTDEEDWAQMGAAALRKHGGSPITSDGWDGCNHSYAKSPPKAFAPWASSSPINDEIFDLQRAREEREAVEALVKLSSV
jgi:hypothetical protein